MNHLDNLQVQIAEESRIASGPSKVRITSAQRKALAAYNQALRNEDRYLGSVFVNAHGQRMIEAKTQAAYEACKALGMTHEHGL